jgi:hypothetical protein
LEAGLGLVEGGDQARPLPSAVGVGHDLSNSLAQILREGLELLAVAQRTESIHGSEATIIEATRIQENEKRTDGSCRDRPAS